MKEYCHDMRHGKDHARPGMVFGVLILWLCCLFLTATPTAADNQKHYEVPVGVSPQQGSENAPVTIIEFIDYQ